MQVAEQPQPPRTVAVDRTDATVVDPASGYLPSLASASTGVGGAGMAADAPSLARWGYLLYGGRIIDGELVTTMTTQVTDTDEGGCGFGTKVADFDGVKIVGHGGDYIRYSSTLLVWPSTRMAVAVLAPVPGMAVSGTLPGWAITLYQLLPVALMRDPNPGHEGQACLTMSTEISTAGIVPLFSSQCVVFRSSGQPTPGP
jgi:D-alanyl-D-alanine carboxypeptidase